MSSPSSLDTLEASLRDSIRYIKLAKQPPSLRVLLLLSRLQRRHTTQ